MGRWDEMESDELLIGLDSSSIFLLQGSFIHGESESEDEYDIFITYEFLFSLAIYANCVLMSIDQCVERHRKQQTKKSIKDKKAFQTKANHLLHNSGRIAIRPQ